MYEGALAKTLVQPLTSYHLFRPPLSQLSFCLVIHLDQLKTHFLDLSSRFNLLSSLICEIKQFCGQRKSWPHCLMITRFIAVKFCNKRLQCLGFYENHLAIIKWGNCSRLECFMLIEVTLVMFSVCAHIQSDWHHDQNVRCWNQDDLYLASPPQVWSMCRTLSQILGGCRSDQSPVQMKMTTMIINCNDSPKTIVYLHSQSGRGAQPGLRLLLRGNNQQDEVLLVRILKIQFLQENRS